MNHSTRSRYAKMIGFSSDQLDLEVLKVISGRDKDVRTNYVCVAGFREYRAMFKRLGIPLENTENFLNQLIMDARYNKAEQTHVSPRPSTDEELAAVWDDDEPVQETHVLPQHVDQERLNRHLQAVVKGILTAEEASKALPIPIETFKHYLEEFKPVQETYVLPQPKLDQESLQRHLRWVSAKAMTAEQAAGFLGLTLPKFNDHLAEFEARARIKAAQDARGV